MRIQIKARNKSHQFDAAPDQAVLYAGLAQGLTLPYECASGTCGTCKARLVSGEIDNGWPAAPGKKYLKGGDEFLMCQCRALGEVSVEVASFVDELDPATCVPATTRATISRTRLLTPDVMELELSLAAPMDFDAGQFVLVRVPGVPGFRGWSMVNFERAASQLTFVVKAKPGGAVSAWLFEGPREGTEVEVFGPLGRATFDPSVARDLLCIAGGSGIAGMMSILERAVGEHYFQQHAGDVFFGVRSMKDAFYLRRLEALRERAGPRLNVTVALSEDADAAAGRAAHPTLHFDTGFVHEVAARAMQGRLQGVRAYLAGPPPAVDASVRMLLMARVSTDNIRYDKFG